MGYLIRTGFWFSLVLLAIPFDFGGTGRQGESVGPVQTFMAAREAMADFSGLCERKPEVCVVGKSAINTVGVRAREAARIAYEVLDENFGETDETTTAGIAVPAAETPRKPAR
jgi:hypothetical protein